MLEVDIDKILPVTEARDNFNKIIDDVGGTDKMYVLTKNGKPSAVVVGVNHLEKLTGKSADELTSIVEKKADETPVVEEVKKPDSFGGNVAGGSKPLETDDATAGQSIQAGSATEKSSPVPSSTLRDEPTGSDSNESNIEGTLEVPPVPTDSVGAPVSPSTSPSVAQRAPLDSGPTSSTQRVPYDSGPGSVPAPSRAKVSMTIPTDSVGKPKVASNQAPAPPNQSASGGAAASDSDLFV